ncbi:MAG: efflux RND transporter periplasmic adaptor subunit [Opitutaceae bacterium]
MAKIIFIVVILAAAAGGWFYWQGHAKKGPEFYTTAANRGDVVESVTAAGTIKPLLDVLVSSQISGYVTAWYKDFNAEVKTGDLLATLLPTSYEAAVKSAQGNLASAKANYDLQKVNLERDKDLLAKNLIAQSDYDLQAAQLEEAEAQTEITQAALDTAKTNLSYCRITSPMDGMVIARNIDVGNSVAATLSSPTLFEIGNDMTKMQIDAAVAEADVGNVANGQTVNFSVDAYPNRQFVGTVYQVRNAPQTSQNVVIYDVMISVDNSDLKLKPGMTANVSIIVTSHHNVLRLANSGLRFRKPDGMAVVLAADPAAASEGAAPAAKQMTKEERAVALRQLESDAGYTFGGGPPSPEVRQKLIDLAKERGIELPDRILNGGGRGGNRSGGRPGASADLPVYRTVYRIPAGSPPGAKPEEVRVRIGITDGSNTEILSGLNEGDVIITGLTSPTAPVSAGGASPFGGGGGGGGGRRGPGF